MPQRGLALCMPVWKSTLCIDDSSSDQEYGLHRFREYSSLHGSICALLPYTLPTPTGLPGSEWSATLGDFPS